MGGGSSDLLDTPVAKHGIEEQVNWISFILWVISAGILFIECCANFFDVFSIMIFGPFFILFSIINIYRGLKKSDVASKSLGIGGILIASIVISVINIYELTPSAAQEPISILTAVLTVPYCAMAFVFLAKEFKAQKKRYPSISNRA